MEQNNVMIQALACLFISAKNYEMDPTVPSSRRFLRQLPGYKPTNREREFEQNIYQYGVNQMNGNQNRDDKFNSKKNELCEWEQLILNSINFELDTYPIFYDIVEMLMAQGVMYTTDLVKQSNSSTMTPSPHQPSPLMDSTSGGVDQPIPLEKKTISLMEKYVDFFTLLSSQDNKLINQNNYLIACSIISTSRKYCHISPVWTKELVQLTGLHHVHFLSIEKRLVTKFE